jgi:hypothetical protein
MKFFYYFIILLILTSCAVSKKRSVKSIEGIYYFFFTEDLSKDTELSILLLKTDSTFSYLNFWHKNDKIVISSNDEAILGKWSAVSNNEIVLTSNYYLQNDTAYWAAQMISSKKNLFAGTKLYSRNNNQLLCYRSDEETHFCYEKYILLKQKEKKFIRKIHALLINNELRVPVEIKAIDYRKMRR